MNWTVRRITTDSSDGLKNTDDSNAVNRESGSKKAQCDA
jgi:hypothetical protein